jgi:hypothetical protein
MLSRNLICKGRWELDRRKLNSAVVEGKNRIRKTVYWAIIVGCIVYDLGSIFAPCEKNLWKESCVEISTVSTGSIEQTIEATGWVARVIMMQVEGPGH